MEITAEQIKAARERRQMTQQELADEVGVSLRTVGSWERGESVPRNRMGAVAEALGLDASGGRDYGPDAIKRRIGVLAKQRREVMGYSRVAFAKDSGVGSDSTVQLFEFGKTWPRPTTLRKFEEALGWKYCITEDILFSKQAASSITSEDLDDPAIDRGDGGAKMLRQLTTQQLLDELGRRFERLESRGAPGAVSRNEYDLAASDDHVEGEDDRD